MEEVSIDDEEGSATDVRDAWRDDPAAEARSRASVRQGLFGGEGQRVQIGRYLVLGTIGAGGMGVVYRAYDPELDRKVALKLVRLEPGRQKLEARLLREGQAMAKLAHPNVVPIFDSGTAGDDVFIAMEHVEGVTLVDWLRQSPRTWREVLAVFVDAARGLAAAHAGGIVHRDFKPTNVLVGRDGRARVLDFGLARALETRDTNDVELGDLDAPLRDDGLTEVGAVVGTPAYIAPERLQGGPGDERSDQYSFAIALFEALAGERPFTTAAGAGPAGWLAARETTVARPRTMPRWIHRILARSLAFDPAARYPSMHALIAALLDDPLVRARRVAVGAVLVLAIAGLAYEAWAWTRPGIVRLQTTWKGEAIAVDAILVDGKPARPDANGELAMEAGLHRIAVERADFLPAETIVDVVRGIAKDVTVPIEHEEGRVDIEVEPRGAAIVIDGIDHGSPLRDHRMDTGTHRAWIRHDGYYDRSFDLRVLPDARTEHYVALAPGAVWSRPESGINLDLLWIGDVDGDGKPELAHRNFNTVTVHDPWTPTTPWRMSFGDRRDVYTRWADLDGDGVQDLVALHHDKGERIVAAWSARTTERRPRELWSVRARVGDGSATVAPIPFDADGDGDPDVVVAGLGAPDVVALDGRTGRRLWRIDRAVEPLAVALAPEPGGIDAVILEPGALVRIADASRRATTAWSVVTPVAVTASDAESWVIGPQTDGQPIVRALALDATPGRDVVVHQPGATHAFAGATGAPLWTVPDVEPAFVDVDGDGRSEVLARGADEVALRDGGDGEPRWRHASARVLGVLPWNGTQVVVLARPGGVRVCAARDGTTLAELAHEASIEGGRALAVDWDGDGRDELAVTTTQGIVAWRSDGSTAASLGLEVAPADVASTIDADGDGLSDLLVEANGPQLVLGPRILWRRRSADAIRAPPIARDFDGDGRMELAQFAAFGGYPRLHLLDAESGIIEASAEPSAGSVIRAAAAIPTADGWDVVHVLGSQLVRFSGRDATTIAKATVEEGYASPAVTDLDGDGRLEVLTTSWDSGHRVRVFDAATLGQSWSRDLSSGGWAEPLALDLDGDPALELVVSQLDGELVAFEGPDAEPLWSVPLHARNVYPPVPLTWTDGASALVTSAGVELGGRVHDLVVLRAADGRELARVVGLGHPRARVATSDADGDGAPDLVLGTAAGTVHARTRTGVELWRFDPGLREQVGVSTAIVAADLERDGTDEILVGYDDGRLRVLDATTGTIEWSFEAGDQIEAAPLAIDVDGDGIREVLLGSHDRYLVCLRHLARRR